MVAEVTDARTARLLPAVLLAGGLLTDADELAPGPRNELVLAVEVLPAVVPKELPVDEPLPREPLLDEPPPEELPPWEPPPPWEPRASTAEGMANAKDRSSTASQRRCTISLVNPP